jgi:hypothetical protein
MDDQNRLARADIYDLDQLDQARARFDELAAATPQRFENAATREMDRLTNSFHARDWAGIEAGVDPGARFDDRRRMMRLQTGAEEFLAGHRVMFDVPGGRWQFLLLATRGERLALYRVSFKGAVADGGGPLAFDEHLCVAEVGEDGRLVGIVLFDLDALDAAYAELDARYEAGEGATYARAWAAHRALLGSAADRDWEALAATLSPALVVEDHRLLGFDTAHGDRTTFVRAQQVLFDLAPDYRHRADHVRTSEHATLVEAVEFGTRDGGAFEICFLYVGALDEQGRYRRFGLYDLDQLDAARARFEALSTTSDPLAAIARPNAATAAIDRWQAFDAGVATDWAALRASCTPGMIFEDRQGFARLCGDRELMIASMRERTASGTAERRLIGTAGERVAITRVLWSGGPSDGRFEIEYLSVVEVDEAGLVTAIILFGAADARAAQREAWARWAAIDPAAGAVAAPLGEIIEAFNAHDRGRWRAQLADELVVDDHRRTGFGRLEGADAYTDSAVALWQLAPETRVEAGWHWPAFGRHGAISVVRRIGSIPDGGGAFESEYLYLYLVARGRITRIEMFEPDHLDAALARFEERRDHADR